MFRAADIESMFPHGVNVARQSCMLEHGRHVDVGAEARTSPDDRRLRSEQIPFHAALAHDGSERREEITDRVGA